MKAPEVLKERRFWTTVVVVLLIVAVCVSSVWLLLHKSTGDANLGALSLVCDLLARLLSVVLIVGCGLCIRTELIRYASYDKEAGDYQKKLHEEGRSVFLAVVQFCGGVLAFIMLLAWLFLAGTWAVDRTNALLVPTHGPTLAKEAGHAWRQGAPHDWSFEKWNQMKGRAGPEHGRWFCPTSPAPGATEVQTRRGLSENAAKVLVIAVFMLCFTALPFGLAAMALRRIND
jgi:hypothetical protein